MIVVLSARRTSQVWDVIWDGSVCSKFGEYDQLSDGSRTLVRHQRKLLHLDCNLRYVAAVVTVV